MKLEMYQISRQENIPFKDKRLTSPCAPPALRCCQFFLRGAAYRSVAYFLSKKSNAVCQKFGENNIQECYNTTMQGDQQHNENHSFFFFLKMMSYYFNSNKD
jgi:hypothetical protein